MNSRDFCIPHVFEVKESIYRSFSKLPYSGDLGIPGQLPVQRILEGTDFRTFFIPHVFEVKESIFRFFTEQPCLSDLDNPCQLQVLQLFDSTGD